MGGLGWCGIVHVVVVGVGVGVGVGDGIGITMIILRILRTHNLKASAGAIVENEDRAAFLLVSRDDDAGCADELDGVVEIEADVLTCGFIIFVVYM